jgi:Concanavalin A-like lectin/glucanases superfamily
MNRSHGIALFTTLLTAAALSSPVSAAVTPQVLVKFNGTLTGATYNLAPGEIDNSFSFGANGSATVAGGLGDVPGDLDPATVGPGNAEGLGTTTGSGFYFYGNLLGLGALPAQNWISEARIKLDVPVNSQPGTFNHFLDVQGDTFYRFDSPPNKVTRYGYWDGSDEQTISTAGLSDTSYSHVALVWNAAGSNLTGYLNGVAQGTVDIGNFDVSSPRIGYGFFARFYNRAIDGKLDAVAFSTYDGQFNPSSDFQLAVPEPASLALLTVALAALPRFRFARRK